jgi:hypothetical protein
MATHHQTTAFTRVKRAAAFVAIVWAVAASFIAFELVALFGLDLALANPGSMGTLMLPQAIQQSTSCSVVPEADSGASASDQARTAAWLLGLKVGNRAQISQWLTSNSAQQDGLDRWVGRIDAETEQLATSLMVPRPGAFVPRNRADANTEFMTSVEADLNRTAQTIAAVHAPDACYLYKLGAYWGYAMMVRMALPGERSINSLQIEYYARKAGLPEELWQPAIDRTASDATSEELQADTTQRTEAVTAHLRRAPLSDR